MKLGGLDISSVKLGANTVNAVYLGSNLVWQNAPVATAATGVGSTSFTANWNAYTGAVYYLLDVSTSSSFTTFVYENQITTSTSYVVIGLEPNTTYYYRVRASTEYDSDAQAFFDRVTTAGGTLSQTEKTAVNQLVLDMKSYSIWTKMKAIYPMVGASAAACAQNLKSSSFTGTFSATGWTYSNTGVLNLGSGEFDTGLNLNIMNSINDISYGYYNRTNTQSTGSFGWGRPTGINNEFWIRYGPVDTNKYGYLFDTANDGGSVLDCRGFNAMSRTASNNKFIQLNSTIQTFTSASSGTLVSRNFIFGRGSQGFENRENALGFIGDGITSQNMTNFYTAVQAFQTTLSRQV